MNQLLCVVHIITRTSCLHHSWNNPVVEPRARDPRATVFSTPHRGPQSSCLHASEFSIVSFSVLSPNPFTLRRPYAYHHPDVSDPDHERDATNRESASLPLPYSQLQLLTHHFHGHRSQGLAAYSSAKLITKLRAGLELPWAPYRAPRPP